MVLWTFAYDRSVLQESLASSFHHIYVSGGLKPIKTWQEFIPYSSHK